MVRVKTVSFEKLEQFYNELKEGKKYRRTILDELDLGFYKRMYVIVYGEDDWFVDITINYQTKSGIADEYIRAKKFFTE